MANKGITLRFDAEGDILYVDVLDPYPEQDSEEIEDGVIARLNPKSHEIENLEVLYFSTRIKSGKKLELPMFTVPNLT